MGYYEYNPVRLDPGKMHAPAANTEAIIQLPTISGSSQSWLIHGIDWSYDDDPASGVVQILQQDMHGVQEEDWRSYITSGGAGFHDWDPPKKVDAGKLTILRLGPAGAGIRGVINAHTQPE